MQLQLRPANPPHGNAQGILLRGSHITEWLQALCGTGLLLTKTTAYALPGQVAASVWGCVIVCDIHNIREFPPTVTPVRLLANCLFIPSDSSLCPQVNDAELQRLMRDSPYLLHPEIGLVALGEALKWDELIELPEERRPAVTVPADPIYIPAAIRRFEIKAQTPEEDLQSLEQQIVPEPKKFEDKPLNALEKLKLSIYRQLFSKADGQPPGEKGGLLKKLEQLTGRFGKPNIPALDKMQADYEELEKRNANEIDKLLDLLKKNPEEALKYAIPLGDGTGRGGAGALNLSMRWTNFSLFGNSGSGGVSGSGIVSEDYHYKLLQEYTRTAEALISQGEYAKAAFVYMKLLKNYSFAAQTLEKGGLYSEAAAVYLKYTGNKTRAAECYVKANMLSRAIELYGDLGKDEIVGDLYMELNRREEALLHYQKVVDTYMYGHQLLKAANLRRDKMQDLAGAQELLLQGWRSGKDSFNCLHGYFSNIQDLTELESAIKSVYTTDVGEQNAADFLRTLKLHTDRGPELSNYIRETALEIISARAKKDSSVISELRFFNKQNALIAKDILRYKSGGRG